jgi:hypothetical protein
MKKLPFSGLIALVLILIQCFEVQALPGQKKETVAAWIAANPTLRPAMGDGLVVKRSDTPARRFTFQASILPPGRLSTAPRDNMIRSERFTFFDMVQGVTFARLEESLRALYGADIHQDFKQSQLVFSYPNRESEELSRRQNMPLVEARHGELRLGDRFAYWIEVTHTERGIAYNGQMTVFLKEYVDKMEAELRNL